MIILLLFWYLLLLSDIPTKIMMCGKLHILLDVIGTHEQIYKLLIQLISIYYRK